MAHYIMLDSRWEYRNPAKYDLAFRKYEELAGNSPVGLALFYQRPTRKSRRAVHFKRKMLRIKLLNKPNRRLNLRGRVARATGKPVITRNRLPSGNELWLNSPTNRR